MADEEEATTQGTESIKSPFLAHVAAIGADLLTGYLGYKELAKLRMLSKACTEEIKRMFNQIHSLHIEFFPEIGTTGE